jgi:hypothetical protein
MARSIKAEFLHLLQSLDNVPSNRRLELNKVIHQIRRADIIISETDKSRQEVCYLIALLFTQMPELMTSANKHLLEAFPEKIALTATSAKKQSSLKR